LRLETKQSPFSSAVWRTNQLIALAEVFREPLTPECLAIYVESLADLSDDQIKICIGRAIRKLEWFPKPAVLREFVQPKDEDESQVEAEAAWKYANDYLHKWGVERMPLYSGGKRIDAPALPPRIEYAVRAIGGLWALNQIITESRPFMKRDFIEAYGQAPIAESLAPQLSGMFGKNKLLGQVKQLMSGERMDATAGSSRQASKGAVQTIKRVPEPATPEQIRDRAAAQKLALAAWQARRHQR
jgi:hypothetical protein